MAVRVGINGFGRIGRNVLRAAVLMKQQALEFVAVNDITDTATLAHLLKYDSVHGRFPGTVEAQGDALVVNGKPIKVSAIKEPEKLPWKALGVELVLESTGRFTNRPDAEKHLAAGARKVVISAPAKGEDITIVMGVNHQKYDPAKHHVLSNASCTTNCLVPVVKVVLDTWGFTRGFMTTIHSYTNDQQILDLPHKDLRRARAAALSIIPTTTGAAKATSLVIPQVTGKIDGISLRVPTPDVSVVELTAEVEKHTTIDEVNGAFKHGGVTDDARIRAAVPTISYLREKGARVVLLSHFGRPKGPDPKASLKQIVRDVERILGTPVEFIPDPAAGAATSRRLPRGGVALLENTRFCRGEER